MNGSQSLFPTNNGNNIHQNSGGSPPSDSGEGIDIQYYIRLLLLNKWKIIIFVTLAVALTVMHVRPMRAIYSAETKMIIENNTASFSGIGEAFTNSNLGRNFLPTQYEIIKSRTIAEKVATRLNLVRHPEFDPRQQSEEDNIFSFFSSYFFSSPDEEDAIEPSDEEIDEFIYPIIVRIITNGLTVEPVNYTQMVSIGFTSNDPQLAADIANTVADVYIESYLEARLEVTRKAATWLSGRLDELRDNLQTSEDRLQEYKERERLVDVEGVRTLDAAELTQLRTNYIDARQNRIDAETLIQQVNTLPTDQLLSIPAILENPIIQNVIEAKADLDRRLADLGRRYGPKHPLMLSAKTEQEGLENQLNERLKSIRSGLRSNYNSALETERGLQQQIAVAKSRLQTVSRKEVRLRELERDVETNRQLYDLFLSRGKEANESTRLEEPPARVVDIAIRPRSPIGPPKTKYIAAAAIAAMGLAVGLIFVLDFLKTTVRTPEDIENKLHVPMLGLLPLIKSNKLKHAFRAFNVNIGFSESIRSIRTSLVLSNLDNPYKLIVVTSSVPGEGKSTFAINIAEAMGQMEKVLLIDGDMRKPTLAKAFNLPTSMVGLSNLLLGKAKLGECIHNIPGTPIDVLASGVVVNNPLELLGSEEFKVALNELASQYDRVFIDSAPIHVVSDAKILSSYADALIYVVKSDATPINIVSKGIKSLRVVNAPITGAVLNQVDFKKAGTYDPYHGVYYEKGYG